MIYTLSITYDLFYFLFWSVSLFWDFLYFGSSLMVVYIRSYKPCLDESRWECIWEQFMTLLKYRMLLALLLVGSFALVGFLLIDQNLSLKVDIIGFGLIIYPVVGIWPQFLENSLSWLLLWCVFHLGLHYRNYYKL